jgi:hypothetical protein
MTMMKTGRSWLYPLSARIFIFNVPCLYPLLFLLAAQTAAGAEELAWEAESIVLNPRIVNQPMMAIFNFRNIGVVPVRLADARSSCECVLPIPDDSVFAPEAIGAFRATVLPEPSSNPLRRFIDLTVVGQERRPVRLWVTVVWLAELSASPEEVVWDHDASEWRVAAVRVPTFRALSDIRISTEHLGSAEVVAVASEGSEEDDGVNAHAFELWVRPRVSGPFNTWIELSVPTGQGEKAVRLRLRRR